MHVAHGTNDGSNGPEVRGSRFAEPHSQWITCSRQSTTTCQMVCLAKLCMLRLLTPANSYLSTVSMPLTRCSRAHREYIFSFIEKGDPSYHSLYWLSTPFVVNVSGEHCREALLTIPSFGRASPMEHPSLLPSKSEPSVKKFIERLRLYRDQLHDDTVCHHVTEILGART